MKVIIPVLVGLLAVGCSTSRTYDPNVQPSMPSYVGNQLTTHFNTITAPVTINNESTNIYNLNITLDAIVNPVKDSIFNPYDVDGILKRSRSRIAAKVIEVIIAEPLQNINELKDLRVRIVETAQKSFDEIYSNWKHAEAFEVEIVITSMSLSQPLPESRFSSFW